MPEAGKFDTYVTMKLTGLHNAEAFAEEARSFSLIFESREALLVLFDWSELAGWDEGLSTTESCRLWASAARQMRRSAIVHDRQWNRQAAILGAVLRLNGVEVRSWRAAEREAAVAWLRQDR